MLVPIAMIQILTIVSREANILYKAPRETPEFARKHGLEFNENHHRWMKSDGSHATQELPEGYKFEVGHSYVIGPKAKNKALRGHEIQILSFAEEGRRAKFEIEGKTGWTNVSYLEQTLELGDKEPIKEKQLENNTIENKYSNIKNRSEKDADKMRREN